MGLKERVLLQHYQRLGGPMEPPVVPPTLQRCKLFTPVWRNLKTLEAEITDKPDQEPPGAVSGRLIKLMTDKRARVFWPHPQPET